MGSSPVSVPGEAQSERSLARSSGVPERKARDRRRALIKSIRQGLLVLILIGAAVATAWSLRPRPVLVDVAVVEQGPLEVAIEESGRTVVKDRYVVSAPTTGRLSRLLLEPGDPVVEGQTVAELSPALSPLIDERTRREAEARLGAALSSLGQARVQRARAATAKEQDERDLRRARELVRSGSLPAQALEQAEFTARMQAEELASAEFAVKVANEEVRVARAALAGEGGSGQQPHIDILAPASGRVLRVHQESAGLVQAGAPLLEVGDPAVLEGVVDLLTTDAVHVRAGTAVLIKGWGGERTLNARVRKVEPSAFTRPSALGVDEQRVNVILAFTDPAEEWAMLGDGYHIEARLILWQSERVLKLPLGAVFRYGSGWATFAVEENEARLRGIEVGHRGETELEVASGAAPGEKVIVHPGDRVKDGVRVKER